jgi:hypothetical protein
MGAGLLILSAGGCRGCFCSNAAKALAETPPPEAIQEQTRETLAKQPSKLSTICGVNVSALADMVLTVVHAGATSSQVKVEGTAVYAEAGAPDAAVEEDDEGDEDDDIDAASLDAASPEAGAKKDAGATERAPIVVDKTKALLCTGVVVVMLTPQLDEHGNAKGWKATSVEVDSVQTPGVHFDKEKAKAKTSSPRRRRRHHHHH